MWSCRQSGLCVLQWSFIWQQFNHVLWPPLTSRQMTIDLAEICNWVIAPQKKQRCGCLIFKYKRVVFPAAENVFVSFSVDQLSTAWTNLCMSDRWQREKPLQQPERLPGRTESGTPAWSVCLSGTAGRHRPEAAQTHLQRCSTNKTGVNIWNTLFAQEVNRNLSLHAQKTWTTNNSVFKTKLQRLQR